MLRGWIPKWAQEVVPTQSSTFGDGLAFFCADPLKLVVEELLVEEAPHESEAPSSLWISVSTPVVSLIAHSLGMLVSFQLP